MNNAYSDHESADESVNKDNPYCFSSCNSVEIDKTDKSVTRTRRRKSSSEKGNNRVCVVCGERASGFNFDRLTCESCKAFFRRNAMKPKEKMKPCPQGGGCNISGSQRKHCPYCRLEKCFTEGMKKELILPPEKLEQRAKPKRRKTSHSVSGSGLDLLRGACGSTSATGGGNKSSESGGNVNEGSMDESLQLGISHKTPGRRRGCVSPGHSDDSRAHMGCLAAAKEECLTPPPSLHLDSVLLQMTSSSSEDRVLLTGLSACVTKLKEPFTPQEHPPAAAAEAAHTLEEAYNRMDTCIRRIIRLVKLLPAFFEMDKQLQLTLLRTNIYGLIIIYSSFFFEKEIKKLCYPVLSEDGSVRLVTVSVSPNDLGFSDSSVAAAVVTGSSVDPAASSSSSGPGGEATKTEPKSPTHSASFKQAVQEDFELYKENTIAAFTELQELTLDDNVLKVLILVIKLFEHEHLPKDVRDTVRVTRNRYCGFLMRYLHAKHGVEVATGEPGDLDSQGQQQQEMALLHFSRMLMSFIDICTLEIRMTEFAKLLSLDGLSPLMREVCSHRAAAAAMAAASSNSNTTSTTPTATGTTPTTVCC